MSGTVPTEAEVPDLRILRAVASCDLVESTALVERLGDGPAAALLRRHDGLARTLIKRHAGVEMDRTDGFLVLFDRPMQAVSFAVDYQRELRGLAREVGEPLTARVGIHFGEMIAWENASEDVARGARRLEIEGLAVPVASRLVSLALPGQILVTEVVQQLAMRSQRDLQPPRNLAWEAHGRYALKGLPANYMVFEVGEPGLAPMRRPVASEKARPARTWRSHRMALGLGTTALTVGVAGALFVFFLGVPALAVGEQDWIVVGNIVNVNADAALERPLATAFRIGLEESPRVNVLTPMAMRQALTRMQLPETTLIDRNIGSEIALREQARAVIVPSIAQYGSRLRITVELVDPTGPRSVWVETADAASSTEILPTMDRLLRSTRARLGESLLKIDAATHALEKATTANLEALRALSNAIRLDSEGNDDQAIKLLSYAIELDPEFAAAYSRRGAILFSQQKFPEAKASLETALAIKNRLSERERMYAAALLAAFEGPRAMLDAWQLYANVHPYQATGPHNVGNVLYFFMNDLPAAERSFRQAAALYNPMRHYTLQTLGAVLLGQERYADAEQVFRTAVAASPAAALFGLADALAAAGQPDDSDRFLADHVRQDVSVEIERDLRRVTLRLSRGDVEGANRGLTTLRSQMISWPVANDRWRVMAAALALDFAQGNLDSARRLAQTLVEQTSLAAHSELNLAAIEQLLHAASWAARLELEGLASEALTLARHRGALDRYPVRAALAALVDAEIHLAAGRTDAARRALGDGLAGGLWETHELSARVFRALGDQDAERTELRWLTDHRGLAYAQWTDQLLGQQARVIALRDAEERLARREPRAGAGR